jgi:hypothetical protein
MRLVLALAIFNISSHFVLAQPDTAFVAKAVRNAAEEYSSSTLHTSKLLNGTAYKELAVTNDSHPYYLTDDWQKSDFTYEGDRFYNTDVLYDLNSDNLVLEHVNGSKIQVIKENVAAFTINNARFVNIIHDSALQGLPAPGFYQEVYPGRTAALTRWTKLIDREAVDGKIELNYRERITHYVRKDSVYTQVKSRASVLNLLSDRKKELKKFLKEEKVRWKGNEQNALKKILIFYDTL